MKINNFEAEGLNEIGDYISTVSETNEPITLEILKELLKTINISFIVLGCNRVQSTLLCQLQDSYVQQSQRYVKCDADENELVKSLPSNNRLDAANLVRRSIDLYKRMTELKSNISGRPKKDDFKYGISYEDGRYILPLAMDTNISISMSGDKLVDLIRVIRTYSDIFADFENIIRNYIPNSIFNFIYFYYAYNKKDYKLIESYYQSKLDLITEEDPVIKLNYDNIDKKVAIGALTSTSSESPIDVYNSWNGNKENESGLIDRVLGYGHTGILEQSRNTFGMMCSLSAYHQFIRHRIQKMYTEPLYNIVIDTDRPYYIPESIRNSKFYDEYCKLVEDYRDYRSTNFKIRYLYLSGSILLLNCDMVKFITSTNAREDAWIFRERLCMTAQTEIREMVEKKYFESINESYVSFKNAVPPCVYGSCKEGKLSCGKATYVRNKYKIYNDNAYAINSTHDN